MSRINTNVNALIAQRNLAQQSQRLNKTLERLSTGYRINRGGDDPAGLIISENLRSQKSQINAAIANAERADQVINIAESGLLEVSTMLLELQGLVGQTANEAGLSYEEKEANQQQIDAILQTIDRIASTTTFQGTKLLNGGFDFIVSAQASQIVNMNIHGAKIGDTNLTVQANVTTSAQHAALYLSLGGTVLDLSTTNPNFTFELAGTDGTKQFSYTSGTTLVDIATQINAFQDVLGVTASATAAGTGIYFKTVGYGSEEFVSIDIIEHGDQAGGLYQMSAQDEDAIQNNTVTALSQVFEPIRDAGQDVGGTINGITARGRGKKLAINTETLNVDVLLTTSGAININSFDLFTLTGGGAKFNLGPNVDLNNQVTVGIPNIASYNLGRTEIDNPSDDAAIVARFATVNATLSDLASGRELNVIDGDLTSAQEVINQAIKEVSQLRGRLGSIQGNVVQATIRALGVSYENTAAAESAIRDTDFAEETANLTRSQIQVAAATSMLGIATSQSQNVLQLIG